jgi:hypothetical protein
VTAVTNSPCSFVGSPRGDIVPITWARRALSGHAQYLRIWLLRAGGACTPSRYYDCAGGRGTGTQAAGIPNKLGSRSVVPGFGPDHTHPCACEALNEATVSRGAPTKPLHGDWLH